MEYKSSYHDTHDTQLSLLNQFEEKARSDEYRVLEVFKKEKKPLAVFHIESMLDINHDSAKRSVTNWTKTISNKEGKVLRHPQLYKTNLKVMGPFKREVFLYDLIENKK